MKLINPKIDKQKQEEKKRAKQNSNISLLYKLIN